MTRYPAIDRSQRINCPCPPTTTTMAALSPSTGEVSPVYTEDCISFSDQFSGTVELPIMKSGRSEVCMAKLSVERILMDEAQADSYEILCGLTPGSFDYLASKPFNTLRRTCISACLQCTYSSRIVQTDIAYSLKRETLAFVPSDETRRAVYELFNYNWRSDGITTRCLDSVGCQN